MFEEEKEELVKNIKRSVAKKIDIRNEINDDEIRDMITNVVFSLSRNLFLSLGEKRELVDKVFNSMRRLDVLQPFIDDKSITEIMVNGSKDIFIEKEGNISRIDIRFENTEKLEDVIQTIVSKVNRVVNEFSPIVDARLSDGSRVNVVLPPIAMNGPILTIRKFPEKPMTIKQLINKGSISKQASQVLERMVKAKYNMFISGGTGSGKTTFLNALSNYIPKDERIITIEDSAELQILGVDNIVKLETRNANMEGRGEITIKDLIKTSLRMRPERIVVGEVRGAEAIDMLQAMNTGHDGSLSTGHANSAADMLSRLETMVLISSTFPLEAIRKQIAQAIDIIIHLSRLRDKTRKVMEITEVVGYKNGEIILNPLFVFEEEMERTEGKVAGSLRRTKNNMTHIDKFKKAGIDWIF